jgi:hypothetical protein
MGGFEPQTEALLRAAGWVPGRSVEVESFLEMWKVRSLPASEPAIRFVREFGGLQIRHPPSVIIGHVEHMDFTDVDPLAATDGTSDLMLREYSGLAAEPLTPVALNRSHMTLLLGPSGRLLGGVDTYLFLYGHDAAMGLVRICAGVRPEKLGEWNP